MILKYYTNQGESCIADPTDEEISQHLTMMADDPVELHEASNDWLSVAKRNGKYQIALGYKETNCCYDAETSLTPFGEITIEKVIEIFHEFAEYGIDVNQPTPGINWVLNNNYNLATPQPATPSETPQSVSAGHTNGYEFEEHISSTLKANGWQTRLTKKSGDQGLDLLAFDDRFKVALQCKRYTNPVSNSAVQEIHTAADFVGASHAVVVTTSTYTASAIQLAEALDVILIKENQLSELRSHLQFIEARKQRKSLSIFAAE